MNLSTNRKALIYQKFRNPEENPLDIELHFWVVEAEDNETALNIAKKSPYVPWHMYLVDIIDFAKINNWAERNHIPVEDMIHHVLK